ncbi:RTA1 like protein-domain-containing protein [Cantharellus anzutake]|uniref:RTA1 like protein-domain-containing protein n=1 Tax=Cantharellus anzutake TaxID=1750568 RepID=UPI001905203C|nr:RTA1 like protein-domain-containing protein [Cantharellus anzutake]KAF8312738.1 RTA1 like protein-domain-containing protein [Cantharellus anzutake]
MTRVDPDPNRTSPYNYSLPDGRRNAGPTEWICILMIVLFGVSTVIHCVQSVLGRHWYLIATVVLCGVGELIGWSGRLWSSINPPSYPPFQIQISTTIISPTFLSAANFLIFGVIVKVYGTQYSRLSPKLYATLFIVIDTISLVIQAVGGGMASAASTDAAASHGAHIMEGGIILQLVAIIFYTALAAEFLWRYTTHSPLVSVSAPSLEPGIVEDGQEPKRPHEFHQKVKLQLCGLILSTLFLFIRSIYRTIELNGGWTGRVISTELYFNVLDGSMIVLAMYTMNFLHPTWLLDRQRH